MIRTKIIASAAVLGLATAPVMAQVAAPVIAPVEGESELEGSGSIIALALVAGIAAIAVFAIADGDDDPVSP
ncbi:MAG: hypothetical protein AAGL68_06940 [Pseudomonadota bacterium]